MLTTDQPKNLSTLDKKLSLTPHFNALDSQDSGMGIGIKIAMIIGLCLSVGALLSTLWFYQQVRGEKRQNAVLEASRVQLQDRAETLQQQVALLETQVTRLREQMKTFSVENANLNKELSEKDNKLIDIEKQFAALEKSKKAMEEKLQEKSEEILSSPAVLELKPLASSLVDPITAPVAMSAEPQIEAKKPEEAAPTVPAPVVSEKAATTPIPAQTELTPLDPQVMTANRKFNFVVINLGLNHKIKMGDTLEVERAGSVIGTIQVEKLYDRFAAATIVQESDKFKIEKGDRIRFSLTS